MHASNSRELCSQWPRLHTKAFKYRIFEDNYSDQTIHSVNSKHWIISQRFLFCCSSSKSKSSAALLSSRGHALTSKIPHEGLGVGLGLEKEYFKINDIGFAICIEHAFTQTIRPSRQNVSTKYCSSKSSEESHKILEPNINTKTTSHHRPNVGFSHWGVFLVIFDHLVSKNVSYIGSYIDGNRAYGNETRRRMALTGAIADRVGQSSKDMTSACLSSYVF